MAWPLPAGAAALLGRSHGVAARLLGSVAGSAFVVPIPLVAGSVSIDGDSAVRRTLDCTVRMPLDHPAVDPFTAEVRAEYGLVESSSGEVWWVPVGTFVLDDVQEAGTGILTLKGSDRWARVQSARFEQPASTSGATVAAIEALLTGADGRITVDATGAPSGTHQASLWDRDRDAAVQRLARSIGADVYFGPTGQARIRSTPTLGDPSVWQVGRGAGGAKITSRRGVSTGRTYNAVVVIGQPQGAPPVYGVARDTAASSRTQYGGPAGRRPRFYKTELIGSEAQATAAAQGLLAQALGVARTLELETLPNPALDAGDVITVEVEPGVWQRHIVHSYTLPLGLGTTPLATRSDTGDDDGE